MNTIVFGGSKFYINSIKLYGFFAVFFFPIFPLVQIDLTHSDCYLFSRVTGFLSFKERKLTINKSTFIMLVKRRMIRLFPSHTHIHIIYACAHTLTHMQLQSKLRINKKKSQSILGYPLNHSF